MKASGKDSLEGIWMARSHGGNHEFILTLQTMARVESRINYAVTLKCAYEKCPHPRLKLGDRIMSKSKRALSIAGKANTFKFNRFYHKECWEKLFL